jgi:glycosyltransferase involved in cell wall biosynthesis
MHILFVHPNFPAQFGHVARHLVQRLGYRCTFVSEQPGDDIWGIRRLQSTRAGGATAKNHFCSRTFENQIWASHAVYERLAAARDVQPDLIVGHSGFLSTMYLRELYSCPMVNYFEWFYRSHNSDLDFRHDLLPCTDLDRLRARTRNALLLLDLENCDAGYAPTRWQRSRLPAAFQPKIEAIFDGIEVDLWRPLPTRPQSLPGIQIDKDVRVVTYVSRGLESMRGFDIFMRIAKRLCQLRQDVLFLVVGEDRVAYGADERLTEGKTFKQWVLSQDDYDLKRIRFVGRVPPHVLVQIFNRSDLHLCLTAPFVLSWSVLNALACQATLLASDTEPLHEFVRHGETGLLCDFFDVDSWVQWAQQVLDKPEEFRPLGQAGRALIRDHYSLDACLPKLVAFYQASQLSVDSTDDKLGQLQQDRPGRREG